MKYALVGHGRMGRAVDAEAVRRGHERTALFDGRAPLPAAAADLRARSGGAELAFEFTTPAAAEANVVALLAAGIDVVCGTTGWDAGPRLEQALAGSRGGLILAPNFSIGMALFARLVRAGGAWLGAAALHEPFILEAHHRGKRDAPSGTARRLAALLLEADPRLTGVHEGLPAGPLETGLLPVACIRAGSEPGTHVVGFDGEHDTITLRHAARGRTGFAHGAVLAAEWLRGRRGLQAFDAVVDAVLARGPAAREDGAARSEAPPAPDFGRSHDAD